MENINIMNGESHKWQFIQNVIDVAEGRREKSIEEGIDQSNFLYLLTSDVFENETSILPILNKDMISYVKTTIRNWRISQIQGIKVDDIFVIDLPNGEKVQLLPELGKSRVGIRRIDSDDVLWVPLIGRSGSQGPHGSYGPHGPHGSLGTKIESRSKYINWIDAIDSTLSK